jgi:hypothetical protein
MTLTPKKTGAGDSLLSAHLHGRMSRSSFEMFAPTLKPLGELGVNAQFA